MRLAVVIPAYNHVDKVLHCLNSLQRMQNASNYYLVQDDASPSYHLPDIIPACAAVCYRNPVNLGFPGNVNAGVLASGQDDASEVVLICNQDVYAHEQWSWHWDTALLSAFDNPQVAVVGARLLFPDGSIQSAGGELDSKGQPYHRCLGYTDPHYHEVSTPQEVDWVTGGAFAVRRSVWDALGGFDTAYGRGYFEDVDFCMKAREAGYIVWYEPRCTLIHEVGSTGGNPDFHKNALLWKNRWIDSGKVRPTVYAVRERFW